MGRKRKAKVEAAPNASEGPKPPSEVNNAEAIFRPQSANIPSGVKVTKDRNINLRRSGRIQNSVSSAQKQDIGPPESINLDDSEREEEPQVEKVNAELHVEQFNADPTPVRRSWEEKIDYLVQSVDEFKSKILPSRPFSGGNPEMNYKSMYIDAQKKITSLVEENQQLTKKLEFALGKVEAYEKMKDVYGSFKDLFFLSNMGKAPEAVINLSSPTKRGRPRSDAVEQKDFSSEPKSSPKRKKSGKNRV